MSRETIFLSRSHAELLKTPAEAFAEAAAAGARGLLKPGEGGGIAFGSCAVAEIHDQLRERLEQVLAGTSQSLIEARAGTPLAVFLDRLMIGWLRAEPDVTAFLTPDRRGSGGFLYDVLRAELDELGLDLKLEPREHGNRVGDPRGLRPLLSRPIAAMWLGAFLGAPFEFLGVSRATLYGLGMGAVVGSLLTWSYLRSAPRARCSECGAEVELNSERCAGCGASFEDPAVDQ